LVHSHSANEFCLTLQGFPPSQAKRCALKLPNIVLTISDSTDLTIGLNLNYVAAAAGTPAERPQAHKALSDMYKALTVLNPDSKFANELRSPAGKGSMYDPSYLGDINDIDEDAARSVLRRSLEGTGIDPSEVYARMQIGASNQYLETKWVLDDIRRLTGVSYLAVPSKDEIADAMERGTRLYQGILNGFDDVYDRTEQAKEQEDQGQSGAAGSNNLAKQILDILIDKQKTGREEPGRPIERDDDDGMDMD